MDIEKINDYVERMNGKVVREFNESRTDGANTWVAFTAQYDAILNKIEVTYDSGEGSQVRVCYYGFQDDDDSQCKAHAAVETVRVNSALMNIVNMRRHGFKDAMDLAERDHISEKGRYLYFREHAKEYDNGYGSCWWDSTSNSWACRLRGGLRRAFDVGERRQRKVGVSGIDAVANSEHKQRIDEARNTVELLDDTGSKLVALAAKFGDVYAPVKATINSRETRSYVNPYTGKAFATMPCNAEFKLNKAKLDYDKSDSYMNYPVFSVSYKLAYDEDTSIVTATDLTYSCSYNFNNIDVYVDKKEQFTVGSLLNDDIEYNDLFYGKDSITVEDFEKPVSIAAARINKLAKTVEFLKKNA